MNKQKMIYILSSIAAILCSIIDVILFICGLYSVTIFICLLIPFIIMGVVFFYLYNRLKKKTLKVEKVESTGDYLTDLYGLLGIPPQYNKDGTLKDIYDLLQIEPMYDENGNRINSIYELLGIVPKFDKNGKEIPAVAVIKNRISKIAKVDLTARVLTRKLTAQEKEDLLIRQTLEQKRSEAVSAGDKEKEKAIDQLLKKAEDKKKEQEKEQSIKVSYKMPNAKTQTNLKGQGAIKYKSVYNKNNSDINGAFERAARKKQERGARKENPESKEKVAPKNIEKPKTLSNPEKPSKTNTDSNFKYGQQKSYLFRRSYRYDKEKQDELER